MIFSIQTAMMPLWIFTLGTTIFDRGHLTVPYLRIAYMAVGLILPLTIGLLIQRYLPRLAKLLVRILKTFSSLLIIFIIIFAIVTNLYLFELFTWQVSSEINELRDIDNASAYQIYDWAVQCLITDVLFFAIDFRCWATFAVDCLHNWMDCCYDFQTKTRGHCRNFD